jgi:hypothetical protein
VAPFGDAVVPGHSASAGEHDVQPGAPDPEDVVVFAGFDHLSLCRHPEVYRHLEERLGGPRAEPAAPPVAAPAPVDGFDWARLRGFKRLVHDGVELGSRFVEKHHRRASAVPFEIIGYVEPLSEVGKLVRVVHDASLTVTYTSIRVVNAVAEHGDDWVVDRMEEDDSPAS